MTPRLYGYWRSSATWRVRIGLHLKGVEHRYEPVHLVRGGGEQHGEAHQARNPMGQVPVLEVEGPHGPVLLTQSLAILEWLDERYPAPPLLPADPLGRARARALAEVVNSGIQPLQNLGVGRRVADLGGDVAAWNHAVIRDGLRALERMVAGETTAFLAADHPTIADCCLVPQLYNARRFSVDLADCPRLVAVEAACVALPAFQAAHPDVQLDAVPG